VSRKKPLACPHCSSPVFVIEGYHEFRKIYDASRKDPVLVTTGGTKDYVVYAFCAGCKKAATDYLMDLGLFDSLYEIQVVQRKEPEHRKK
jgi:hypothetical protein